MRKNSRKKTDPGGVQMKTSQEGIELIKQFEDLRLTAYKAVSTEKYFTIGYGHCGADVKQDMVITHAEAEAYLRIDLQKFEKAVNALEFSLNQNQFDGLVSFTYNCGPENLKKLVSGRTLQQIADAMLRYNHAGGKELSGLTRRRHAERELFLKGEKEMKIIIGSARIDENGKAAGGKEGDQKQKSTPDYTGEVSMQEFYVSSKGWLVLRPKNPEIAMRIAAAMITACNNKNIGYDQSGRDRIMSVGTNAKQPTECDCSSLVRKCVLEASGKDPGNFTTANEASMLKATGLFMDTATYTAGFKLCTGDILVTKTKGHTAVVASGYARDAKNKGLYPSYDGSTTSIVTALREVGETDTSFEHRKVIALVNGINDYSGSAVQNTGLLNLLKQGMLIRG